ncbi:response regulator [Runella slithyformis]|uniref:Response regulator n=1 Tax=Runella slithyformis (strain ATCC 29530 / DSM 19594 / LMG 11500 / NCIMB 11436 / LSU 4) TaxID=761193 RepID=A0A7U3ZJA1_RUNSL|nr:response regulator [Runella slithyformis]AEI48255.1 hypothetical protein Runsl_1831 [Runella slithyformis DSM 19594]
MNLIIEFEPTERAESIALKPYLEVDYDVSLGNDPFDMTVNALVEDKREELKGSEVILINYIGNEENNFLGLILGHHIRLHSELRQVPIAFIGTEPLLTIWKSTPELSHLLLVKGIGYFSSEAEALEAKSRLMNETKLLNTTNTTYKESFLDKIIIPIPEEQQGRHGVANQWGAYRMAQVAGIEEKIKYKYPKTLYFKHLLAQAKSPKPITPNLPTVKKILFIDDNYQKGWKDCLEGLFGEGKIDAFESWEKAKEAKANEKIENDEYDLVFLDFYLGEGDIIGKGKEALGSIKVLNSVLPVIMFTASNKAWNMHDLHQAGADGYYVKEHPETAKDPDFSVKNFENFQETINSCIKKGKLLSKFWKQKKLIEKSTLLVNKPNQINRERILERLTMFIGLLKKANEQTKFDTNTFFYSDWELAFLTLWSILNEIQEIFYEKTPLNYPNTYFQFRNSPQNRPSLRDKKQWKFINGNKGFINYDLTFRFDSSNYTSGYAGKYQAKQKSVLKYDKFTSPYYFIESNFKETFVNFEITLHNQIAFLLLNSASTNSLLIHLKELNEFRNHLYLTHGEDTDNADFFKLYREQRMLDSDPALSDEKWQEKIKQLFEIIYFLCIGNECAW